MTEVPDGKMPRGAIATVVVGLAATAAAALLTTDASSSTADLAWERSQPLAAKTAALPGAGELRLSGGGILSTRENASDYVLYRVGEVLSIKPGGAAPAARVRCEVVGSGDSTVASTPGKRAAYPLPSEELSDQDVPERSVVKFYVKGTDLSGVELEDAFSAFTNRSGAQVDWEDYREGRQAWIWDLPPAPAGETTRLGFATIWKAMAPFSAQVSCSYRAGEKSATISARASF